MFIHQISIFIENKFGKLSEILSLLGRENIRIIAATVADTSEFGILRMIVSDTTKTYHILKENNVSASLSEVLVISVASTAETFASTLDLFTKAGLSIEYMYCFSVKEKTFLILKVNNRDVAYDVIRRNNIAYITENELINL
jgi:hypothetical protein